ncbi:chitin synthase 4 [Cladophialophora psammophila CBS 110553]|uniref:chitin synthase n=1 Tax=Cladophialophora psammophila CBS 110553 TaxID=1182543 RepID=W9XW40_9EURO|nr:chitin synthase 4 [Cladophialophora psammophila CBS 110553]EXJ74464.1 chitin synthase 4 [Cladophialophora psammophila CBS 110553]
MSAPPRRPRPATSPTREKSHSPYKDSPFRRLRDIETGSNVQRSSPYSVQRGGTDPYPASPHSSGTADDQPIIPQHMNPKRMNPSDLGRQKSLIRPERNRIDRDHPNYYYRKHAQNMEVLPSTTGNDPVVEELAEERTVSSESTNLNAQPDDHFGAQRRAPGKLEPVGQKRQPRKLVRKDTRDITAEEKRRLKDMEKLKPPSAWNVYCAVITFWAPNFMLQCCGMPGRAQKRAWREKVGLISIIFLIAAFVGFLTFGFTRAVCPAPGLRLKINHVDRGYMIFHGDAYNLDGSMHPAALGIPLDSNVLYDLPHKYGGQDGSFMFQKVNGECKGLITLAPGSDVPTDADGDLAWYFPCNAFNQDGSSPPNLTNPYYLGYACHTTAKSRNTFYNLRKAGEVFFTWDDVKNTSRNLVVYSGSVVDLDLLRWFNKSQVAWPKQFDDMRESNEIRGTDITHVLQSPVDKKIGRCLTQIAKVGSVDTETVGCIASKVVLYVSLVFILAVVLVKFFLALAFQWFLAGKFAATKTSQTSDPKKRAKQIEDWADDIYRPAPKITDPASTISGSDARASKRGSQLFPQTSRFTSPYAVERISKTNRPPPTTMTSQSSNARLMQPGSGLYKTGFNSSQNTLDVNSRMSVGASRSSLLLSGQETRYSVVMDTLEPGGPLGFIHENVVPQPPPEWQPFGYPLAHCICLVTAYSEDADGVRTTLDSIATTDYPNSHKAILVICDGLIKGQGNDLSTPEIVLSMMGDFVVLPEDVQAFSYVAVSSGSKRHNMAKVYAGFYDYGPHSKIDPTKQQRVPMLVVVKCGTPDEAGKAKPGNRGKRDSQIILMSFLQKVMFDERMTELEYEMFNGLWKVTGMSPDFYEMVLMVDADTKVYPDSLTHMVSAMVKDPEIMGLCGETKIANKTQSWVSRIQVFEYFISHHLSKSFESVFGGVTCLPGCFCMYRIKSPKGGQNYWVPILANPDIVEHYSENVVDTLHKKNLLLLGEDRYLSTLMLKTFPKRKQVFVPQAVCKTTVPDKFKVLLSQRRRWINSTVHNLMELVLVRDLCGTFCFSMQFVVFIELIGTLVLPAAIAFTFYLIIISIVAKPVPVIPLILLGLILGLPAVLIVLTAHSWSYVAWMGIYLLSLPIWNFVLPAYAYWKFDDFSWGDTRKTAGETKKSGGHGEAEGEFDSSKILMKRWGDFERERRAQASGTGWAQHSLGPTSAKAATVTSDYASSHGEFEPYHDY